MCVVLGFTDLKCETHSEREPCLQCQSKIKVSSANLALFQFHPKVYKSVHARVSGRAFFVCVTVCVFYESVQNTK